MDENTEDIIDLTDIDDIPDVDEEVEETPVDQEGGQVNGQVNGQGLATEQVKDDGSKLLEALKGKVKYNGEDVEVKSLDELIATYQKGLNYDKLYAKQENADNAKSAFIDARAKRSNMSPEDYMKRVEEYEKHLEQEKQEKSIKSMMDSGVDEVTARRVAQVEAYMDKLKTKEDELNAREEAAKAEAKKDEEYKKFLEAYPGIEVDKIPKEVFEQAKDSNLLTAYTAYENKALKEKLKQMEQNTKNMETSVVKPTGGATEEVSKDPFEIGFDSAF